MLSKSFSWLLPRLSWNLISRKQVHRPASLPHAGGRSLEWLIWNPEHTNQIELSLQCGATLLLPWLQPWAEHCCKESHHSRLWRAPWHCLRYIDLQLKVVETVTRTCKALTVCQALFLFFQHPYEDRLLPSPVFTWGKPKAQRGWVTRLRSHCWRVMEWG